MAHVRIAGWAVLAALVLSFAFLPAARAGGDCGTDAIAVTTSFNTISVLHQNAWMNCCRVLSVRSETEGMVVRFYESDLTTEPCRCMCCFNLAYQASGFASGRYTVRVFDETGGTLFGETTVDVIGSDGAGAVLSTDGGICTAPQESDAMTWGRVRSLYR